MKKVVVTLIAATLSQSPVFAKGGGVGVHVQGIVSSVRVAGSSVVFLLRGTIEVEQYHGQQRSVVTFSGDSMEVTSRQGAFCFIMIQDNSWLPGPCRSGQVQETLLRASREKRPIRVELAHPTLRFGETHMTADVVASEVTRIYDATPQKGVAR